MHILLIKPGEYPEEKNIDGSLKSMQALVGGLIQAIYPFDDAVALVCNEEGKLEGLPLNRALTDPENGQVYDIVCGTFFICGLDEESFASLSPSLMEKYWARFYYPELFFRGQ